jgi:DMSO reductase anchor subunit
MHPAYSVILFTTASGAGYGLLLWLRQRAALDLVPRDPVVWLFRPRPLAWRSSPSNGLLSLDLHLGRPERAWRALSQWRPSSWLSREGVAAKEMGYTIARKHAAKLRTTVVIAFLLALIVLVAAQFAAGIVAIILTLAAASALGFALAVERWLFFAEARHVSMLYYGVQGA